MSIMENGCLRLRGRKLFPYSTPVLRRRRSECVIAGTVDRIAGARSKTLLSQSRFSFSLLSSSGLLLLLVSLSVVVLQLPRLPLLPTSFHNTSPSLLFEAKEGGTGPGGGTRSESKIEADDTIPKDRRHLTRMAAVD